MGVHVGECVNVINAVDSVTEVDDVLSEDERSGVPGI